MKLSAWPRPGQTVYRYETGYTNTRDTTALDVVNFEANELGNEDVGVTALNVAIANSIDLEKIPATEVTWFALTPAIARRYQSEGDNSPIDKYILSGSAIVLAEDGDGGFLVWDKEPLWVEKI